MTDKVADRHVFISHAADDPDWSQDAIETVASAILNAGFAVRLDLWKQTAEARFQSLGAWRAWMDDAVIGASHIFCLVSPRYQKLWQRRFEDSKDGLALAAILDISNPNRHGQNGYERIITLRPKDYGLECVPAELVGCLSYEWTADRHRLLSWLLERQRSLIDIDADRADGAVLSSTGLSDGLILDGLHYPDRTEADDSAVSAQIVEASATVDGATLEVDYAADIGELSVVLQAHGISTAGVTPLVIEVEQEKTVATHSKHVTPPSLGTSGMWLAEDEWRAPIGDSPPLWASAWGDDPYGLWADLTVNGATQRMRWIEPSGPAGFLMGSPQAERDEIKHKEIRDWANQHEHDPRRVLVVAGFWLADTPCTQAFWRAVAGVDPSHFSGSPDAPERPVEMVDVGTVMNDFIDRFAAMPAWGTGDGLCLPTELEWEYAARAGTHTAYWWGDAWDDARANLNLTGIRRLDDPQGTTPVHRYPPNPWGLHDVHGNVFELCADVWQGSGGVREVRPDENHYVVRGGSWLYSPDYARAACRTCWHRKDASESLGFRFALRCNSGLHAGAKG
ncbi:MAG: SUMF1/EgtB/PvdO family nonheme iron enzyme [Pseudomonadota bacterium]